MTTTHKHNNRKVSTHLESRFSAEVQPSQQPEHPWVWHAWGGDGNKAEMMDRREKLGEEKGQQWRGVIGFGGRFNFEE